MKHKIEINISEENIRIIESIINDQCHTLVSSVTLEDAVVLGTLKQILREMEFHDGWIRLSAQEFSETNKLHEVNGDTDDK
jgi:hypothetical protein